MIYQLETHIAQQLKDFFDNFDFIDKVVIFGSRAKHTANPKSDIDLCIYSLEMSDEQFSKLRFELDELPILYKLDIVHFEKVNRELQDNVEKDGKLLFIKEVKISEIGRVITGKTPKTSQKEYWNSNDIPFIKPTDFNKDINILSYSNYVSKEGSKKVTIVPKNSVLVTCIGTIGKVASNNIDVATNQQINSIVPNSKIYYKYLVYQMLKKRDYLIHISNAPVVPIINKTTFENISIYLPTLTKQKKIAKVLDRANELITLRKESIEKLDKLSKSIFIDMFGDPVLNPKGWEMGTLRDLLKKVNYGTSSKANVNKVGIPILRMNNITYSGHLDILDLKFIELSKKDEEKYILDKGDILFNRTNSKELVGKTTVFNLNEKYSFAGYLIRAKVNKNANPYFVSYFLNSEYGKLVLLNKAKSIVGMANINAQEMQNISCYIPPITLQNKFANIIEKIEEQKVLYEQQLKLLEDNFNSLLQRSFS